MHDAVVMSVTGHLQASIVVAVCQVVVGQVSYKFRTSTMHAVCFVDVIIYGSSNKQQHKINKLVNQSFSPVSVFNLLLAGWPSESSDICILCFVTL